MAIERPSHSIIAQAQAQGSHEGGFDVWLARVPMPRYRIGDGHLKLGVGGVLCRDREFGKTLSLVSTEACMKILFPDKAVSVMPGRGAGNIFWIDALTLLSMGSGQPARGSPVTRCQWHKAVESIRFSGGSKGHESITRRIILVEVGPQVASFAACVSPHFKSLCLLMKAPPPKDATKITSEVQYFTQCVRMVTARALGPGPATWDERALSTRSVLLSIPIPIPR